MGHVRHSIRAVAIECLELLLMRTHDHQVWTNMVFLLIRMKPANGAHTHVRNADAINMRRAAAEAVLHPEQEHWVETCWLIVLIQGNTRGVSRIEVASAFICWLPYS
jgi:hypothetical protein